MTIDPRRSIAGRRVFVTGASGFIGRRLVAAGVVRDETTFRLALWMSGSSRTLKAGEYQFDGPMTPLEVLDKIARGDVLLVTLTFREGLTVAEMSRVFEAGGFGPAASNVLVERFTEVPAFEALYDEATTRLRDELLASGLGQRLLDARVQVLAEQAADLVDADTLAEEADAISAYFVQDPS